jgi:hypothetical protein
MPTPRLSRPAWLFVFIPVVGCATPGPVVRLNPPGDDVAWVAGRGVLARDQAGIRVAAAFDHQDGDRLGVRIEVQNDTEEAFVVSPHDVTFMACTRREHASCGYSYPVVDPEGMLLALDAQRSRERADAANEQAAYVPLLMLSLAADVASLGSKQGHRRSGLHTASIGTQMQVSAAQRQTALLSIEEQRAVWSNGAFRRTTVTPGGGAAGLVYLSIDPKARYLWLHVRAGGQVFPFGFEQRVHDARFR